MAEFIEVAERVWVARHEWADVNVSVVAGARGVVVIDTLGSADAGRTVLDDVRRLGVGDVHAVVNTHWHWDHCFGNAAFRAAHPGVPIHAHEETAAWLAEEAANVQRGWSSDDPHHAEVIATEIVLPDRTFSSVAMIDLDDRVLELVHPGRAHTSGDLLVCVPDADVMVVGDLVEESAKPSIGKDSWPLEWPLALDVTLNLMTADTVVVPGHGACVDRDFVSDQRAEIGLIAEQVRHLAGTGVALDDAVAAGEWPWGPDERIAHAVRRGYEHLPRSQKRLPLL